MKYLFKNIILKKTGHKPQLFYDIIKGAKLVSAIVPCHWLFFCLASKICLKTMPISLILKPCLEVALVIFAPDCRPCLLYSTYKKYK